MSLGLRSREEYLDYRRGPYLPSRPDEMYAEDWVGWDEFLGVMRSFDEARYIVRHVLRLSSVEEYNDFVRADTKRAEGLRIPARPDVVYKDEGWESFDHFFGIDGSNPNDDQGKGER